MVLNASILGVYIDSEGIAACRVGRVKLWLIIVSFT